MAQKRQKSDFEGSGGLERLERRGTKLERGTGHICWDFQTNWECGGDPNFGPGAPKITKRDGSDQNCVQIETAVLIS